MHRELHGTLHRVQVITVTMKFLEFTFPATKWPLKLRDLEIAVIPSITTCVEMAPLMFITRLINNLLEVFRLEVSF